MTQTLAGYRRTVETDIPAALVVACSCLSDVERKTLELQLPEGTQPEYVPGPECMPDRRARKVVDQAAKKSERDISAVVIVTHERCRQLSKRYTGAGALMLDVWRERHLRLVFATMRNRARRNEGLALLAFHFVGGQLIKCTPADLTLPESPDLLAWFLGRVSTDPQS